MAQEGRKISCTKCKTQIDSRGFKAHVNGKTCESIQGTNERLAQGYVLINQSSKYNWLWTPFVLNSRPLPDWLEAHLHVSKGLGGVIKFVATPQCAEAIAVLHKSKKFKRHAPMHEELKRMLEDEDYAAQLIIAAEIRNIR